MRTLRLGAMLSWRWPAQYGKGHAADLYLPHTHCLFGREADGRTTEAIDRIHADEIISAWINS